MSVWGLLFVGWGRRRAVQECALMWGIKKVSDDRLSVIAALAD